MRERDKKLGLIIPAALGLMFLTFAAEGTPTPVGAESGENICPTHVVEPGQSLSEIGKLWGVPWQSIYKKNKDTIGDNPGLIYPGQRFSVCNPSKEILNARGGGENPNANIDNKIIPTSPTLEAVGTKPDGKSLEQALELTHNGQTAETEILPGQRAFFLLADTGSKIENLTVASFRGGNPDSVKIEIFAPLKPKGENLKERFPNFYQWLNNKGKNVHTGAIDWNPNKSWWKGYAGKNGNEPSYVMTVLNENQSPVHFEFLIKLEDAYCADKKMGKGFGQGGKGDTCETDWVNAYK